MVPGAAGGRRAARARRRPRGWLLRELRRRLHALLRRRLHGARLGDGAARAASRAARADVPLRRRAHADRRRRRPGRAALRRAARHRLPAAPRPARLRALARSPTADACAPRCDRALATALRAHRCTLITDPAPRRARRLLRGADRRPPGPVDRREPRAERAPGAAAGQPHRRPARAARSARRRARQRRCIRETDTMTTHPRPPLPERLRQRVRQRGRRRRLAAGPQQPAARAARPVCRAAVGHRLHRAARTRTGAPGCTGASPRWSPARYQPLRAAALDDRRATASIALPPEPLRWEPIAAADDADVDFVDGMRTLAANGDAEAQTGMAAHVYLANRSMERRAFVNADGEMLLVPQQGAPGRSPPRWACSRSSPARSRCCRAAWRSRSALPDGPSRGYVCENYGAQFRLPELGPIGSNGLANARDFQAPVAAFEDASRRATSSSRSSAAASGARRCSSRPSTSSPGTATWRR